jgi:hypothetical protein
VAIKDVELATVAARMKELVGSAEWAVYRDMVLSTIQSAVDQLLQSPADKHDQICGRINGLRDALTLPQIYIQRSKANG